MSGLEVIGSISSLITLIDAAIKIYDNAHNDLALSKAFEIVRCRLPVIHDTLETCKSHLEERKGLIPGDVCDALLDIINACDDKAVKLKRIFEKIIPGESDALGQRSLKVLQRFGKGNKIECLMGAITEDVQLLVNHDTVKSANPQQRAQLEDIIKEVKSVTASAPDDESSMSTYNSGGGIQNINNGSGKQYVSNGSGKQYNAETQTFVNLRQKEDFAFRGPVGICLGQAPYLPPGIFVGRCSELDKITENLHPVESPTKQRRQVLGGMGGIGKTQLAIAFAESRPEHHSSVFWLNAASEVTLKDGFQSIASLIFDIQDFRVFESKEAIRRVHSWLSDPRNTTWLLIFDNYDDPDQFDIVEYYPPSSHGAIIITTRRPDLVTGEVLHVKPLHPVEDGLQVLQIRSKRQNIQSDPCAQHLAERLAGLPLALATAGIYLQHSNLTFERYLQEYEKRWSIDPRCPAGPQEYRERTLYTTWDITYSRLEVDDSDAANLLKLLAYFGNQNIYYELLFCGLDEKSPDWLCEVLKDFATFDRVMRSLTKYHFLENHLTSSSSWSMHNCVHDWTLATLNKDLDRNHYLYAFECVHTTISEAEKGCLDPFTFSRAASHATQLVQPRFLDNDMISSLTPEQLEGTFRLVRILQDHCQFVAAKQMSLRALVEFEKTLGPDHISALSVVHNLGSLYKELGKLEKAENYFLRALAGMEKVLGPDDIHTVTCVSNLGMLYRHQDKLGKAEHMYTRALSGFEKTLGLDDYSTTTCVNNLGLLYHDQGKLDEAEKMCARALSGFEKTLGPKHDLTNSCVNNLGLIYRSLRMFKKSEQMFLRALAYFQKSHPEHTSTLQIFNNIGNLYYEQGKLDEAAEMLVQAVAGFEKALGPDHLSTLNAVNSLGALYYGQDKLEKAEKLWVRALSGLEKELGPAHTTTVCVFHNTGALYYKQGKLEEAEQLWVQALARYEKTLGPNHASTLDTVESLGAVCYSQGKLEEAEKWWVQALAGYEKTLGPNHASTLSTAKKLGKLYSRQGKIHEAKPLLLLTRAQLQK